MKTAVIILTSLVLGLLAGITQVSAQQAQDLYSLGIAQQIELLVDAPPSSGSLVTFRDGVFQLSQEAYDPQVVGVVVDNPAVAFEYDSPDTTTYPLLSNGKVPILVTSQNGAIRVGDRLTSSDIAGVAMLSDQTGLSIGVAEEAFDSSDPNQVGTIIATLDIKFTVSRGLVDDQRIRSRLQDVINLSTIAALQDPQEALRFMIAALILLGSIAFSFLVFGRTAQRSIIALGRNPLASRAISFGMVINILMAVVIIFSGVLTAWFVIRL